MIITIAGPPGSGKDTVANLLVSKINEKGKEYELLSIGDLRRIAAQEKGMTIEEFNEWSLKNPNEGDAYFDNFQREHAKKTNDFVLVSRLGWHLIPHSFKIYIDVDPYEGARRIFMQKQKDRNSRNEIKCSTVKEQMRVNEKRIESDKARYYYLYKINPYDTSNYELILDSTDYEAEDAANRILERVKTKV